jgi:hypothetical protein
MSHTSEEEHELNIYENKLLRNYLDTRRMKKVMNSEHRKTRNFTFI